MYGRILVPTDGSAVAEQAAEAAVSLTRQCGADLYTIYVQETGRFPFGSDEDIADEHRRHGTQAVSMVADRASDGGVEATTDILENRRSVHQAIVDYVTEYDIDCVVMGTHGRSGAGQFVLGSVAEQTLRESPVPVMTVHEETINELPFESLLVPVDGSESADVALEHAIKLASVVDGTICLIHVVDVSVVSWEHTGGQILDALERNGKRLLEDATDRIREAGIETGDGSVVTGHPSQAICEYATEHGVGCIVLGTHGRTGLRRFVLGSVAERVVRHSEVPVIATKQPPNEE